MAIGREIAKATAEQLVPVTLELGGKCPAILTDNSVEVESIKQIFGPILAVNTYAVPHHVGRRVRQLRRRGRRAALAAIRRHRSERLRPHHGIDGFR